MKREATLAAAASAALFAIVVPWDLAPWLRGPAPYPPEWQWEHRQPLAPLPPAALLLCAAATLLVAASGHAALRSRERASARALTAAAVLLGFALPVALLAREPAGALRTLLARTTSFSVTSYHTAASSEEARDALAFVRRHAELLPALARTAKHAATHPVGPVLYFRAANALCEAEPPLSEALLRAAGLPERDFAPPLTRPARAGALLGALGLNLLAALAAWPVAGLARALGFAPLAAARAALLWTLVPAAALVAPRFDAALALPIAAYALLVARAVRERPLVNGLLAGLAAGLALLFSYGAAAFLVIAGLAAAIASRREGRTVRGGEGRGRPALRAVVAIALSASAALALSFGVPAALGGRPVEALRLALAIHHQEYTAARDYTLWLLFDPVDFAALGGVALVLLGAASAIRALLSLGGRGPVTTAGLFGAVVLAGLAALVVSGSARGEVGRLWVPLVPLLLVCGLERLDGDDARPATIVAALTALGTLAIAMAWRV